MTVSDTHATRRLIELVRQGRTQQICQGDKGGNSGNYIGAQLLEELREEIRNPFLSGLVSMPAQRLLIVEDAVLWESPELSCH